jgi:hypothetical protein
LANVYQRETRTLRVRLGAVVMSGSDSRAAINFLEHWTPGGPWVLSAIEPDGPI